MGDNRRTGLNDTELEAIADGIARRINPNGGCKLTHEQQDAVVGLLMAKKRVVKWTLYLVGAMILWVLKDVYFYIANHITWGK